jgi:hypothetical protein
MTQGKYYTVEYRLELENGSVITYTVEINKETLISKVVMPEALPDWTRLDNEQCSQCAFADSEYCPIAIRLVNPVQRFSGLVSHTRVTATVVTPERTYMKQVDVQDALRSLFGLIMATSGCPSMQPFKYMARYHLPFSSIEETISRITSTYLLRQWFRHEKEPSIPVNLGEIEGLYNTVQSLNEGMARRLKGATFADGAVNAIVILSAYSSLIPIMISKELAKLKSLFSA